MVKKSVSEIARKIRKSRPVRRIGLALCFSLMLIPLCSTKCPNIGAEWNPTGDPIGGGPGYREIITSWDFYVTDRTELLDALVLASTGDIIYIADTVSINLTGDELIIPGGATLASGRGRPLDDTVSWGALLYTNDVFDSRLQLFTTSAGDGIRLTGLRIRGPYHYRAGRDTLTFPITNYSFGVFGQHDKLEVDNCEFWGWSHSAIFFSDASGYAHHNYIHQGQNCGQGLGVMVGHNGEAIIEANLFDYIRENIASTGDTNSTWEACYNIGLEHAACHNFDRHGWPSPGDYGGKKTVIHHNTSRNLGDLTQVNGKSVRIRGMPTQCCSVYNNWFYASDSVGAITLWTGDTNCFIFDNHFGTAPRSELVSRLPIALANASPDSGTVPLVVTFVGAGSFDPDGMIAWYEWDFGDNANTTRKCQTSHTFDAIGVYNVRLTIHDDDGIPDNDCISIIAAPSNDSFYVSTWVNDRYHSSDTGFFYKQILIDDHLIWEDDIASCEGWIHVVENVNSLISGHDSVTLTLRLCCKKGYTANRISDLQTYWDDVTLFWGDVKNGNFEQGYGSIASHWNYSESHQWFHGAWTSDDVRSGDRAYRIFFYRHNDCNAGEYGEISQRVPVGALRIPQSDKQSNLYSIYPNPGTGKTTIVYRMSFESNISVKVYDMSGRLVWTFFDERQEPGLYRVDWDGVDENGRNVANGVYFCKLIAAAVEGGDIYTDTKKVVYLR